MEEVKDHPEANTYGCLIVALLEREAPMTLDDVAKRFEEAGIAPADRAMESLQRELQQTCIEVDARPENPARAARPAGAPVAFKFT